MDFEKCWIWIDPDIYEWYDKQHPQARDGKGALMKYTDMLLYNEIYAYIWGPAQIELNKVYPIRDYGDKITLKQLSNVINENPHEELPYLRFMVKNCYVL